jgi:ATP/maltotriose-dependent transcriptional regulator MalT
VLSSTAVTPAIAAIARVGLALLAVNRNDPVSAQAQLIALDSARSTIMPGMMISTDRLLGLLAETTGNIDRAIAHFEAALAFCGNAGYRPEYAQSACDQANVLLQRNRPGDRGKASALLTESFDIAGELGMGPLHRRVAARQAQAGSGPGQAPGYPDGLTQREAEVLRLIAMGQSNRDIAQELVVSVRTVERHITNIYGKINARGRADATAYTLSHHLADPT